MSNQQIDLLKIFNQVSKTLKTNQDSLNQSDEYNHDHGDHMVEIFEVITAAMKTKKNSDPADQLEYAAQLLRKKSTSGSAKSYVEGLTQASKQVSGKSSIDMGTILPLLQTLLGGSTAKSTTSSDGLSSLLGSLLGGSTSSSGTTSDSGLDLGDLLGAGLSLFQSAQGGDSSIESLSKALVGESQSSGTQYRNQSGELIANTVLQMLSGFASK